MQADLWRHTLRWLFPILIVFATVSIPVNALHAQITAPTPTSTPDAPTISNVPTIEPATEPATDVVLDDAAIQAGVDALIEAQVNALIAQMDTEDKVGQLFLVNFPGNDTGIESDIAVLIHAYRVGGVEISPAHRNFSNGRGVDTPDETARLTNRLQALAFGRLMPDDEALFDGPLMDGILFDDWARDGNERRALINALPTLADALEEADLSPQNIPLFVAVEQLGDDLAATSLRRRFTALPDQMTLGAAWNPELAQAVGSIVGQELSAVGVNLLLGPILDVYGQPRPDSVGQLGIHMYGGNPYWVGELSKGYISGIHRGSDGRLLTVARHFPGQGDVDRLPEQEVATIQADIQELRRNSLSPFSAVAPMGPADADMIDDPSVTDMMMSSHMRFSGIQPTGPGRDPPLSLSPELTPLLINEGFELWMESGLIMSGPLGAPAIQRFYETDEGEFPIRQVAKEAFLAGNDILSMGHDSGDGDWEEERVNIESTISFFQEQYEKDLAFADEVDESLRRILRTKVRLYADMDALEQHSIAMLTEASLSASEPISSELLIAATPVVEPVTLSSDTPLIPLDQLMTSRKPLSIFDDDQSSHVAEANGVIRQIARESLTVLYPDITEPSGSLPQPPKAGDQIVTFTDSRLEQECRDCTAEVAIGPDDIANIILQLYGPEATGQISPDQLTSLTFGELVEVLNSGAQAEGGEEETAGESGLLPMPEVSATPAEVAESAGLTDTTTVGPVGLVDVTAQIEQDIDEADWLIFAMLNVDAESDPNSDAVKRFLRERKEQIEDKEVVVLALNAPYFLDSTEISALSSYLGVYSKSQPFLENAVRAIFRNFVPSGAPPVSVPGTRFSNLEARLQPDPAQTIAMQVLKEDGELLSAEAENGDDVQPSVAAGETIRIQVGPVLDRNGQPTPDGRPVEFRVIYEGAELALNVEPVGTNGGMAVRDILLERGGQLRISASSGEAVTGEPFSLLVTEADAGVDGAEGEAGSTPSPDVTPTATLPMGGGMSDEPGEETPPQSNLTSYTARANLATLFIALITLLGMLSLLLIIQIRILPRTTLVHNILWTAIVGLAAYVAYGVGLLPGAAILDGSFGLAAPALVVFVGMVATMLWLQLRSG